MLPSASMANPNTNSAPRTTSGGVSIGNLIHPPQSQFATAGPPVGFGMYVPSYTETLDPYLYGSEGSHSPASDHFARTHRQSISEASSVHAYDPSSLSPVIASSIPGVWSTPPVVLPSTAFGEGQAPFTSVSQGFLSHPVPLLRLISPSQPVPCHNISANWMDMSSLQFSESYPWCQDSFSTQLVQNYPDIYDPIA